MVVSIPRSATRFMDNFPICLSESDVRATFVGKALNLGVATEGMLITARIGLAVPYPVSDSRSYLEHSIVGVVADLTGCNSLYAAWLDLRWCRCSYIVGHKMSEGACVRAMHGRPLNA